MKCLHSDRDTPPRKNEMRYPLMFAGLCLGLCLAFTTPANAQTDSYTAAPTATLMARSALLGIQLNVRERRQKGQISTLTMSCIEDLDAASLTPVYLALLTREWGHTVLSESDAFFRTPLGEKVAKISLLGAYSALKQVPPEPAPELTSTEQSEFATFSQTEAGLKLYSTRGFTSEASRQSERSAILELAQSCGLE